MLGSRRSPAKCRTCPPRLTGQTKTVWRWFMKVGNNQWLNERAPGDYTKVEWLKLSEKTD